MCQINVFVHNRKLLFTSKMVLLSFLVQNIHSGNKGVYMPQGQYGVCLR